MRRILTTSIAALAVATLLASCSFGSSSDKKSDKNTSTSKAQSTKECLVGTWGASAEDLKLFDNTPGDSAVYSTPTGKVKFSFTKNGNFTYIFDNVSTIATEGGDSNTIKLNGSVGGTYAVSDDTFKTDTTTFNVSISYNDLQIPVSDTYSFQESLKKGDKASQGFSCSGNTLTITSDDGETIELTKV